MENQLFSWTGWDEVNTTAQQFYDCTLLVDIGSWKQGSTVSLIAVDWQSGVMEFFGTDPTKDAIASFNLFVRAEEVRDED